MYNDTPDAVDIIGNDENADEEVRSGDEKPSVELRSESVELRSEAGAEVEEISEDTALAADMRDFARYFGEKSGIIEPSKK